MQLCPGVLVHGVNKNIQLHVDNESYVLVTFYFSS